MLRHSFSSLGLIETIIIVILLVTSPVLLTRSLSSHRLESSSRPSSIVRRALSSSSSPSLTKQATLPAQSTPIDQACVQPPINNQTWITLGIDNYLASYPNGTNINLHDYARINGGDNFICGIGGKCNAGQLCSPIRAPAWEVLVAAQQWNNFQNMLYDAVGTAVQIVTATSSALVTDLYPPEHTGKLWDLMHSLILTSGLTVGIVATTLGISLLLAPAVTIVGLLGVSFFTLMGVAAIGTTMAATGAVGLKLALKGKQLTPFEKWANYAFYLSEWQQHVQRSIANSTRTIINSGISTPQGISNVLKNGTYFMEIPQVDQADLMIGLKNTTTVRIVVNILRNQGAFVTIGSDKCTDSGPGGAWHGKNVLSYCSPNGTMMNIIHGGKNHVENHWFNADKLQEKYGISTEYLVEQSYQCQLNHHSFEFDPYKSGIFPDNLYAECIANFPVCDFRDEKLAEAKKEYGTMKACRKVGKLPI